MLPQPPVGDGGKGPRVSGIGGIEVGFGKATPEGAGAAIALKTWTFVPAALDLHFALRRWGGLQFGFGAEASLPIQGLYVLGEYRRRRWSASFGARVSKYYFAPRNDGLLGTVQVAFAYHLAGGEEAFLSISVWSPDQSQRTRDWFSSPWNDAYCPTPETPSECDAEHDAWVLLGGGVRF